ncbi:UNVERIFIED_CONTAM: GTP-binding protein BRASSINAZOLE INSENSITIVE PALE GREEN 2, chloroplastic [Sesamum latifolium]|uniref:GTP-binding protein BRASSINAZOLE INSENSITIVE PALE GREEN 2, chloroplastic n=1 Tax=Sesamum latifolium TaxID=2727402 RepID=A0AAW2YF71_9LAMI
MAVLLSSISLSSSATNLNIKLPMNNQNEANPLSRFQLFTGLDIGRKKDKHNKKDLYLVRGSEVVIQKTAKIHGRNSRKGDRGLILSEGRDEDENYGLICPGCGVFMQDKDPNLPGYFQKRKVEMAEEVDTVEDFLDGDFDDSEDFEEDDEDDIEGKLEQVDESGIDWDSEEWELEFEDEDDHLKELDGFTPAGVGNYGQVKNEVAENLIPDFDFDRLISTRLVKPTGNADSTVVVMVVDCVDFDGSFPKRAAKSLFKALAEGKDGSKLSKKLPKLVLVATKVDLLPSQISPARLDRWVRHRAKANGAPKLSGVYMVSARKDLGVRNLLAFIKDLAGPRGNVWVIGAQNAGKSTLINAFSKKEGVKVAKLTEAPIPGTTLGILRIGGILPAKAKMYDTPGLLHPYLMSMRLNRDEQKMIEMRKELQPRSFRIKAMEGEVDLCQGIHDEDSGEYTGTLSLSPKAGQAIHVGGLVRLDLDRASVETIYVTVWASASVSLHLGKIESADEIKSKHAGIRLQPPVGTSRVSELGEWVRRDVKASGTSWDVNSTDVWRGLGWFSLGLKGEANLTLWTYDGIQITLREPLVLDRAPFLERPGFWLPKAISDAIGNQSKLEAQSRRKGGDESTDVLSEVAT